MKSKGKKTVNMTEGNIESQGIVSTPAPPVLLIWLWCLTKPHGVITWYYTLSIKRDPQSRQCLSIEICEHQRLHRHIFLNYQTHALDARLLILSYTGVNSFILLIQSYSRSIHSDTLLSLCLHLWTSIQIAVVRKDILVYKRKLFLVMA